MRGAYFCVRRVVERGVEGVVIIEAARNCGEQMGHLRNTCVTGTKGL